MLRCSICCFWLDFGAFRRSLAVKFIKYHNFCIKERYLSGRQIAFFRGGPEEIRTLDLTDANRALYQLSYKPEIVVCHIEKKPQSQSVILVWKSGFGGDRGDRTPDLTDVNRTL